MKEFKGQLKGFPKEVVKKMLKRQVQQGNKKDVSVFDKYKYSNRHENGFDHNAAKEGSSWWDAVMKGNFDLFFERYPKKVKKDKWIEIEEDLKALKCSMKECQDWLNAYREDDKEMDRINRWAKLVNDSIGNPLSERIKQITLNWDNKKDVLVDTNTNEPIREEPKEKPFPKLMKGGESGVVVLFTEQKIGTVVIVDMPVYVLGFNYDDWDMSAFQDCEIQVK